MPTYLFDQKLNSMSVLITNPQSSDNVPGVIRIGIDGDKSRIEHTTIVMSTQMSMNAMYQLTDSIGGDSYLTVFGEAVRPITIGMLLFEDICRKGVAEGGSTYGMASFIDWWEKYNVSQRSEPVSVTFGMTSAKTIKGFIISASAELTESSTSVRIWNVSISLLGLPRRITQLVNPTSSSRIGIVTEPPPQNIGIVPTTPAQSGGPPAPRIGIIQTPPSAGTGYRLTSPVYLPNGDPAPNQTIPIVPGVDSGYTHPLTPNLGVLDTIKPR
jgi:hypothetical protein